MQIFIFIRAINCSWVYIYIILCMEEKRGYILSIYAWWLSYILLSLVFHRTISLSSLSFLPTYIISSLSETVVGSKPLGAYVYMYLQYIFFISARSDIHCTTNHGVISSVISVNDEATSTERMCALLYALSKSKTRDCFDLIRDFLICFNYFLFVSMKI